MIIRRGRQGGQAQLDFAIFGKKINIYFFSFEWKQQISPLLTLSSKNPLVAPLEKSFQRPWL